MENIEYGNITFIRSVEAAELSKNPLGLYPDNEEFLRLNCKFLKEKMSEGYKPLGYDPHAFGFYFEKPKPLREFTSKEKLQVLGVGNVYIIKGDVWPKETIILDGKKFLIYIVHAELGTNLLHISGKFLDETQ